jgi:hypothetical protein
MGAIEQPQQQKPAEEPTYEILIRLKGLSKEEYEQGLKDFAEDGLVQDESGAFVMEKGNLAEVPEEEGQ